MKSKNEFVLYDTYAEMILCDKQGNEKARVLIDIKDVDKVKQFKWYFGKNGYCCSKCKATNNRLVYLHRFIIDSSYDKVVDHIDGNKLNNKRNNLRECTRQNNSMNIGVRKNNQSGCTGVSYDKTRNKWMVCIVYNYKTIHLGRFKTLERAKQVRKKAEIKYFGDYRYKE